MQARRSMLLGIATALVTTVVAAPASADPRPTYEVDQAQVDALVAAIEADGVETVSGERAGAAYVGQVPDDWNGDLVVWAHGYRGEFEDAPLLTVDAPPARQWLLDEGYAWIASSYRRNSYDPGVGVLDTKNVTQVAQRLFGRADQTYLAGVSMGGHVTAATIERFPQLFDGALPACGVLGDVELFDYFLDYNLAAAAYADVEASYPDADWLGDEVVEIKRALSLYDEVGAPASAWAFDGSLLGTPDLLAGPGDAFKDFVEVGSGGERVTYDAAWDYWHFAGGGDFFFELGEGDGTIADRPGVISQNSDTVYAQEYGAAYAFLDDEITRVTADNRLRRAQGTKPAPIITGDIGIPVLTMHTIGDLFVPIEMEQVYAREVAANGASDLLVQRAIRDVGHCTFSDSEWIAAYGDLFAWVEDGTRPGGDDLLADISDPLLGCEWTISDGTATARGGVRAFPCP